MKKFAIAIVVALLAAVAVLEAQGIRIMGGATSDLVTVDTNKNLRISPGFSARPTYVVTAGAQVTTVPYTVSIESGASVGFKLARFCVGVSVATAAVGTTVTIQRRTTASSGGTALTNEGTSTLAVSKMDPADGSYAGVARLGGSFGTGGATLGQFGFTVGELGAGAADPSGLAVFCRDFGQAGDKMPVVSAGASNGITITVTAAGAGGLSIGSIDAVIIAE